MRSAPCKRCKFRGTISVKQAGCTLNNPIRLQQAGKRSIDQVHFIGAAVNWKRNQRSRECFVKTNPTMQAEAVLPTRPVSENGKINILTRLAYGGGDVACNVWQQSFCLGQGNEHLGRNRCPAALDVPEHQSGCCRHDSAVLLQVCVP